MQEICSKLAMSVFKYLKNILRGVIGKDFVERTKKLQETQIKHSKEPFKETMRAFSKEVLLLGTTERILKYLRQAKKLFCLPRKYSGRKDCEITSISATMQLRRRDTC